MISHKEITQHSSFLDVLPKHSNIMAVKGLNLFEECTHCQMCASVSAGRRVHLFFLKGLKFVHFLPWKIR